MSNSRQDNRNPGHKNQVAIYPIEGRTRATLNYYKNRGCINCNNNLSEEISISSVHLVLSSFQSPSLLSLSVRSVLSSSVQRTELLLGPHLPSYPVHPPRIPSLPPNSDPLQRKAFLSTLGHHKLVPSSQPSSLTVITRLWSTFISVIHRDRASIGRKAQDKRNMVSIKRRRIISGNTKSRKHNKTRNNKQSKRKNK